MLFVVLPKCVSSEEQREEQHSVLGDDVSRVEGEAAGYRSSSYRLLKLQPLYKVSVFNLYHVVFLRRSTREQYSCCCGQFWDNKRTSTRERRRIGNKSQSGSSWNTQVQIFSFNLSLWCKLLYSDCYNTAWNFYNHFFRSPSAHDVGRNPVLSSDIKLNFVRSHPRIVCNFGNLIWLMHNSADFTILCNMEINTRLLTHTWNCHDITRKQIPYFGCDRYFKYVYLCVRTLYLSSPFLEHELLITTYSTEAFILLVFPKMGHMDFCTCRIITHLISICGF